MLHDEDVTTDELRRQIDSLDERIVDLWRRRTEIAQTIGGRRLAAGGPRIVPSREDEVIARYQKALGPATGRNLAELVLYSSRGPAASASASASASDKPY
jgi:chorismate mutase